MRNKITTIIGYTADPANAPNDFDERMAWIDAHSKATYRSGHWNEASALKIAEKMGITHKISIKHHN